MEHQKEEVLDEIESPACSVCCEKLPGTKMASQSKNARDPSKTIVVFFWEQHASRDFTHS